MAYDDFKDLAKKTIADKVLRDKVFKIASHQKWWILKNISLNGI